MGAPSTLGKLRTARLQPGLLFDGLRLGVANSTRRLSPALGNEEVVQGLGALGVVQKAWDWQRVVPLPGWSLAVRSLGVRGGARRMVIYRWLLAQRNPLVTHTTSGAARP